MQAYIPSLYDSLGIFIPLIVVNCIILGRAESYASKNPVLPSIFDGIGMGLGFTLGLTCIGIVREFLGSGTVFGMQIIPESIATISIFVLAPGAFFVLAFLVALINKVNISKAKKAGTAPELCKLADCASCGNTLCGGRPAVETNVVAGVEKAAVSENKEESAKDAESKKAALKTDDSIVVKNEVTSTSEKNAKINKEEKRGEE
jgi:electron transport complex protein RnfE